MPLTSAPAIAFIVLFSAAILTMLWILWNLIKQSKR